MPLITIRGTSGNDALYGRATVWNDDILMYGYGGDDHLRGVSGSGGSTRIYSGGGNDIIEGWGSVGNTLYGGAGADWIGLYSVAGEGESFQLYGGSGNDYMISRSSAGGEVLLDGGRGADVLNGDTGREVYIVDSIRDVVNETYAPNFTNVINPRDEVRSSIDWTLHANIEDLTLLEGAATGAGNHLANQIVGNAGDNRLVGLAGNDTIDGGAGKDVMEGGAGKDTYYLDHTEDHVSEEARKGTDRVYASASYTLEVNVEELVLEGTAITGKGNALSNLVMGNAFDNILVGYVGKDRLDGWAGNDKLHGGMGADLLTGGAGDDHFVFRSSGESAAGASRDVILDLEMEDRIDLSSIDASVQSGRQHFTFIESQDFSGLAGQLRFFGETLLGDTNGDGAAEFELHLVGVLTLEATSLIL